MVSINPFEKYARQIGSSPQGSGWKFQKCLSCHHLETTARTIFFEITSGNIFLGQEIVPKDWTLRHWEAFGGVEHQPKKGLKKWMIHLLAAENTLPQVIVLWWNPCLYLEPFLFPTLRLWPSKTRSKDPSKQVSWVKLRSFQVQNMCIFWILPKCWDSG